MGVALKGPTGKALEAMESIVKYPTLSEDGRWDEAAAQIGWTAASVGAMLGTWVVSATSALLLYAKKCQLEMMDYISGRINEITENQNTKKQIEATE